MTDTLDVLRDLGSVAELSDLAAKGLAPLTALKYNSHIHLPPNFSAFDSVTQAVTLAAAQDVRALGVSNYYDYRVYADFVHQCKTSSVFPMFGLEIIALDAAMTEAGVKVNDPNNPGRFYICGKGITRFDHLSPAAADILGTIRRNDEARMRKMIGKLSDIFAQRGFDAGLDEAAIIDRVVTRHGYPADAVVLQERHVAQAFQEALFAGTPAGDRQAVLTGILGTKPTCNIDDAVGVQGEIRSRLMKAGRDAFVTETFVSFDEAYKLILALGGIPTYPTLADGANPICEYEDPTETLIANCRARDIYFAELIPIRNTPEVFAEYVKAYHAADIPVVAGTEHNTLDLIGLHPTCRKGTPMPPEVMGILWEGVCVVAAHQFLVASGECGFVDETGKPNPDHATDRERIESFASLGAAVIERYFQTLQ